MKTALKRPLAKAFLRKCWQLIIAVLAFTSVNGQGDAPRYAPINGYGFKYKRHASDSIQLIPLYASPHTPFRAGAIKYRESDSSIYKWTGTQWLKEGGAISGGIDTVYTQDDTVQVIVTPDETYFTIINSPFTEVLNDSTIVIGNDTLVIRGVGTGSGVNNTIIGTGYRWLLPGTQEIKTVSSSWGINWDSTSNANSLTPKIDSAAVPTMLRRNKGLDSLFWVVKTLVDDTAQAIRDDFPAGGGGDTTIVERPIYVASGAKDTIKFARGIGVGIDTDSNAMVNWVPEYSIVNNYSTNNKRSDAASSIVLSNGRIWTWYTAYGSTSGDNDSAVIAGKYSDDGGRTWEGLDTAVQNTSNGSYIPSVYFNPARDTLRMLYFRQNASNTAQIYMTYSVDFMADNPSWSTPTLAFGSGLHYMSPAADRVFVNKAGTYFYPLPIHINGILASSAGRYDGYLLRSTDGGANWDTIPGVRLISPDTLNVEGGLYQTDDAVGIMTYYFRTRSGQVYFSQSTTAAGNVWGAVYPSTLYAPNSTTTIKYLEKYKTLVAVHNQYEGAGNVNGNVGRRRMVMSVKHLQPINANGLLPVDGVSGGWQQVYEIDSATGFQFIEPTVTFTGNNILVTYSKGDYQVGDTFILKSAIIPYYFIHGTDSRYTSNLVLEKTFNSVDPNWIEFYITGLNKTNDYFKLQNQSSGSQFGHKPWFRLKTTSVQNPQFRFDVDMPTSTNAAPAYYFNQITNAGQYSIGGTASSFKIANNDVVHHEIQSNGILHIRKISDGSSPELLKMYLPVVGEANGYTYFKNVTGGTGAYATWLDLKAFNSQYGLYITPHSAAGNGSVWIDPDNGSGADVSSSNTLLRVTNFGTSSNDERFRIYGDGSVRFNNQTGEMMRLDATGGTLKINTSAVTSDVHQRKLYINGSIGANKDSLTTITTPAANWILTMDTAAAPELGRFKKLLPSYFASQSALNDTAAAIRSALVGGITSINSQTGPAISITANNGISANTTTNAVNVGLGGTLTTNTSILGASNFLLLGSSGSKLSSLTVHASDDINMNADDRINLLAGLSTKVTVATDADITVTTNMMTVVLPDVTANRTLTLPSVQPGMLLIIHNQNSSGSFVWNISGVLHNPASGTVSSLGNDTVYWIQGIDDGVTPHWKIVSSQN